MDLAVVFIDHIKPGGLFFAVIYGAAALFRRGVSVALLGLLLNLVACVATGSRTGDRGHGFAAAAADLMAQNAANHRAKSGPYQSILVLHRLRMRDGFIVAFTGCSTGRLSASR